MALLDQLFGIQPQSDGGLVQNILQQRFQPAPQDSAQATYQTVFSPQPVSSYTTQAQRMALPMQMAGQLSTMDLQGQQVQAAQLQNQMLQMRMKYMQNRMGGGNGIMPPLPMTSPNGQQTQPPQNDGSFPFAANQNEAGGDPRYNQAINDAWMLDPNQVPKLEQSQIENDPTNVRKKERANKLGGQDVEDVVQARGTQDVMGLYNKLNTEAKTAPSGVVENLWANATNAAGKPNAAAIAKGSYEADLNNLYLGMIRSLKGTGRVMQSELDELKNAQPKPTDSMEVKQAKIKAHMQYYINRMTELGYDPKTGRQLGNNQLAPNNLENVDTGLPPSQGNQSQSSGLDESDPRVGLARQHGYSDDEIRQYLMKGQQ